MWLSDLLELVEYLIDYAGDMPVEYLDNESNMIFEVNDLIITEEDDELIATITNKIRRKKPSGNKIN